MDAIINHESGVSELASYLEVMSVYKVLKTPIHTSVLHL